MFGLPLSFRVQSQWLLTLAFFSALLCLHKHADAQTYQTQVNTDYAGNDLLPQGGPGWTQSQCETYCDNNASCILYEMCQSSPSPICYAKYGTSTNNAASSSRCTSYVKTSPGPITSYSCCTGTNACQNSVNIIQQNGATSCCIGSSFDSTYPLGSALIVCSCQSAQNCTAQATTTSLPTATASSVSPSSSSTTTCSTPYSESGYAITCDGSTCSAVCASGYDGTAFGTVVCSLGTYVGSFSGCGKLIPVVTATPSSTTTSPTTSNTANWVGQFHVNSGCATSSCCCLSGVASVSSSSSSSSSSSLNSGSSNFVVTSSLNGVCGGQQSVTFTVPFTTSFQTSATINANSYTLSLSSDSSTITVTDVTAPQCSGTATRVTTNENAASPHVGPVHTLLPFSAALILAVTMTVAFGITFY